MNYLLVGISFELIKDDGVTKRKVGKEAEGTCDCGTTVASERVLSG